MPTANPAAEVAAPASPPPSVNYGTGVLARAWAEVFGGQPLVLGYHNAKCEFNPDDGEGRLWPGTPTAFRSARPGLLRALQAWLNDPELPQDVLVATCTHGYYAPSYLRAAGNEHIIGRPFTTGVFHFHFEPGEEQADGSLLVSGVLACADRASQYCDYARQLFDRDLEEEEGNHIEELLNDRLPYVSPDDLGEPVRLIWGHEGDHYGITQRFSHTYRMADLPLVLVNGGADEHRALAPVYADLASEASSFAARVHTYVASLPDIYAHVASVIDRDREGDDGEEEDDGGR